jgi:protein O-GlcNAc transferase
MSILAPMDAPALLNAALERHRAGDVDGAARLYESVLAIQPDNIDALNLLGLTLHQRGRDADAIAPLERAVALQPAFAAAWLHLGTVLRRVNRPDDAARAYTRVSEIAPGSALGPMGLGQIAEFAGDRTTARRHYVEALKREPNHGGAHFAFGTLLASDGDLRGGLDFVRKSIALDPNAADHHLALAALLFVSGDGPGAVASFKQCLTLAPAHLDAWASLIAAHCAGSEAAAAQEALGAMEKHAPANDPRLDVARGQVANLMGRPAAAIAALSRALRNMIGAVPDAKLIDVARVLAEQARGIDMVRRERLAAACDLLGTLLPLFDDYATADALFVTAAILGRTRALKNRIAVSLYDPTLTLSERRAVHLDFGEGMRDSADNPAAPWVRRAGEKIRIGYVSSDFRRHPVARSMRPLFHKADRARFAIQGYNLAFNEDDVSREFAVAADGWHHLGARPDAEIAEIVRKDGIDILVHVAGHFDENRPGLAWQRAAPVQVSLFDAATSGIAAIDYLIADRHLAPKRGGEFFAERVFRLPNLYIHPWLAEARILSPRDAAAPVVFASFSNPTKLNGHTLETWARVLRAVEGSTLLLGHARAMTEPEIQTRFQWHFAKAGVAPARIAVRPYVPDLGAHLASYESVDVVLDPFPFNGSTSSFEALSMGIPVVSLTGETMMSRWSGAMLASLGLERCRAADPAAYVRVAQDIAADRVWREKLRAELPDRVKASALVDEERWMRHLERAYRAFARRAIIATT